MASAREVEKFDIVLAETMDISTVQNLHVELKIALGSGDPVSLDGSNVVRADTAALQVLAAMFIDADGRQPTLELHSPSEALTHNAALLGIDQYIGLIAKKTID